MDSMVLALPLWEQTKFNYCLDIINYYQTTCQVYLLCWHKKSNYRKDVKYFCSKEWRQEEKKQAPLEKALNNNKTILGHSFAVKSPQSVTKKVVSEQIPDGAEKAISCALQALCSAWRKKCLAAGQWKNHCHAQHKNVTDILSLP